jgi:acid stress chaperone HdeB
MKTMNVCRVIAYLVTGLLLATSSASAQVTLDLSKITCEQYRLFKVTDPQKIAIWLSGYYHGLQKTTVFDPQHFEKFSEKLSDYCRNNFQVMVLKAAETLMAAEEKAAGR